MKTLTSQRLVGRVGTVPGADGYGFISLATVEGSDGNPPNLDTTRDIFIHQEDCGTKLRPGLVVEFSIVPRPGHSGEYRATGAIEIVEAEMLGVNELVPAKEPVIPGFSASLTFNPATEIQIAKTKLPIHFSMKVVPVETVEQVVKNQPMPTIPRQFGRGTPEEEEGLLNAFLLHLFPHMAQFGTDFKVLNSSDEMLDQKVKEVSDDLDALGMGEHVTRIKTEVGRFRDARNALKFTSEEGLVRPDTIVPIRYLPDLFMAVPVWFYYMKENQVEEKRRSVGEKDPHVHVWTKYFCDLFPNLRWADTFQLYNRRLRSLADYGGEGFDMIPPFVARRLKWAVKVFDFVIIATPYHDLAGRDWQDLKWLRSIDPYVLGFKKGIPYIFILARFSDSGTFPLYHQLVGDTIEFLRKNIEKLDGFNTVNNPFWYNPSPEAGQYDLRFADTSVIKTTGEILKKHVWELLRAFDQGNLFDWLRMEDVPSIPATR